MTSSARARIAGGIVRPSALGLEIDDQLECGRLLDRQTGGFGTLEDFTDVTPDLAKDS